MLATFSPVKELWASESPVKATRLLISAGITPRHGGQFTGGISEPGLLVRREVCATRGSLVAKYSQPLHIATVAIDLH